MSGDARISGGLPSGHDFSTSISSDMIALRVGDKVCLASPQWMTVEQARRATEALAHVIKGYPVVVEVDAE